MTAGIHKGKMRSFKAIALTKISSIERSCFSIVTVLMEKGSLEAAGIMKGKYHGRKYRY